MRLMEVLSGKTCLLITVQASQCHTLIEHTLIHIETLQAWTYMYMSQIHVQSCGTGRLTTAIPKSMVKLCQKNI